MPPKKLKLGLKTKKNETKAEKAGGKKQKRMKTTMITVERETQTRQAISDINVKSHQLIQKLPEVVLDHLIYTPLSRRSMEKMSVVNVKNKPGKNYIGTPKDFRFGTLENNVLCGCCKKTNQDCVGHMGHIDLKSDTEEFKIIHPFFRHNLVRVLQCVCNACGTLVVTKDLLKQKNILSMPSSMDKIKMIVELSNSIKSNCSNCGAQKTYTYKIQESGNMNDLNMVVTTKDSKQKHLRVDIIENILKKISDEDAKILGFEFGAKPIDYIMDFIPVLPICSRPYTVRDDQEKDEYLTLAYSDICSKLAALDSGTDEDKEEKKNNILYYYTHICDNKDSTHRLSPTDICKSITDRLKGKEGLLRGHLLGKRSDYTGRTPIGPNRTLKFGDIAPPMKMQSILTIPEIVTKYNIDKIKILVEQNKIDKYSKRGSYNLKYSFNPTKKVDVQIGDLVYRHSMDGDVILFNRQPTLHKQSMLGYFCKFQDKFSIGLHLSSTTGHNADFDGDEGNIHMLQTVESQVEGKLIMCAKNCIMSSNASSPIASIIFNSLSGAYLLSKSDILDSDKVNIVDMVTGTVFRDGLKKIITNTSYMKTLVKRAVEVSESYNVTITAGRLLCSALFPEDFWYAKKDVKIIKGILISGILKKNVLGNSHGSIIQSIFKFYGKTATASFISDANFLFNWYLELYGLTVSVNNCKPPENFAEFKRQQIEELNEEVLKMYDEGIENIEDEITDLIEEKKGRLDKKVGSTLDKSNPLVIMADSGAKGKTADTGKLIGLLGQQFVNARRPDKLITNNKRWLTTFSVDDNSIYSRGFTTSSFYEGLNPDEFFAHAQASRIGLTDTAVKTSDIGALQRRMVKVQEDLIVNYDGSVRNQNGIIYQFNYGVGLNCENMITSKDGNGNSLLSFIDMKEAVGRVNQEFNYLDDLETTIKSILSVHIESTDSPDDDFEGPENVAEALDTMGDMDMDD